MSYVGVYSLTLQMSFLPFQLVYHQQTPQINRINGYSLSFLFLKDVPILPNIHVLPRCTSQTKKALGIHCRISQSQGCSEVGSAPLKVLGMDIVSSKTSYVFPTISTVNFRIAWHQQAASPFGGYAAEIFWVLIKKQVAFRWFAFQHTSTNEIP